MAMDSRAAVLTAVATAVARENGCSITDLIRLAINSLVSDYCDDGDRSVFRQWRRTGADHAAA
jgi:hypothetical protein